MSYDFEVYSKQVHARDLRQIDGEGCLVSIWRTLELELEDIPWVWPKDVQLPTLLTRISIEGPNKDGCLQRLPEILETITDMRAAVVVDQQTGQMQTPGGLREAVLSPEYVARQTSKPSCTLSWYFADAQKGQAASINELIAITERMLPEAMPARYGTVEPPEFKLTIDRMPHFRAFLADESLVFKVLYHTPPCQVWRLDASHMGPGAIGWRSGLLTVRMDASVLNDKVWLRRLEAFWLAICQHLQPFYAEIAGAGVAGAGASQHKLYWNGIPKEQLLAQLIGPPYAALWPEFHAAAAKISHGLYYRSRLSTDTASQPIWPAVPDEIARPRERAKPSSVGPNSSPEEWAAFVSNDIDYPPIWPFGPTKSR